MVAQRCRQPELGESSMSSFSTGAHTAKDSGFFKDKPKGKKVEPKRAQSAIQIGEHGRYQIKSGRLAGEYVARAFPKPPTKAQGTKAQGMIAEARGATEDAAIAALRKEIDARELRRTEERRIAPGIGSAVPSTEEYIEAIAQITLSRPQAAMLAALAFADDEGLSESRIAFAAGYKSKASAVRAFAAAGRLVANYLSIKVAPKQDANDAKGTMLLAFRGERPNDTDLGNWILHPELREAVRSVL